MFNVFIKILKKEIRDNFLSNKAWFTVSFFLLCLLIFPLALGQNQHLTLDIFISAIWIATLFANLISLDQMYKEDHKDGTLLYYTINGIPLSIIVYAKCLSHWFFSGIPIIVISPICFYLLSGNNDSSSRTGGTISSSIFAMMQGVQILRVHDVNEIKQSIKVFEELIN